MNCFTEKVCMHACMHGSFRHHHPPGSIPSISSGQVKGPQGADLSVAVSLGAGAQGDAAEALADYEVGLGETVWDAALLCGLPPLNWAASALLVLSLILNTVIQFPRVFI